MPFSGKRTIDRHLRLVHGHSFSELDRTKARYSIIHDLIETIVLAWKYVQLSEVGDSALKGVEDVLKISHHLFLR